MSTRQRALRLGIFAVAAFLLLPLQGQSAVLDVSSSQSLAGIMAAASPGDILILACGTYQEEGIVVTPGVTIRSVSGQADCVILETSGAQPVLVFQDAGPDTRVEGLIFTRAAGDDSGAIVRGGGVVCNASSPQFIACEFNGLAAAYGGAVYCGAASSPSFQRCEFVGNQAFAVGGAIACVNTSSPTFEQCLLAGNVAAAGGGAINAAGGSAPILQSCTLVENLGGLSSGMVAWDESSATVDRAILAHGLGGGAWAGDAPSVAAFACSDLFENQGGDWTGALADQAALAGNRSADPIFCYDEGSGSIYSLSNISPCADTNSACGMIGAFPVGCLGAVGAPDDELPVASRLQGNYPNPFNPRTRILFDVGQPGQVTLTVYDLAGRRVRQLVNQPMIRGSHAVIWEGDDSGARPAAAGVYFLRLETVDAVSNQRITLIK